MVKSLIIDDHELRQGAPENKENSIDELPYKKLRIAFS